MLEQVTSRSTDLNGWTSFQPVSLFLMLEQIRSTDLNGWTPIQEVSPSPVFVQIRSTDHNGWTPIQLVSCCPVLEEVRSTDQDGWTPSACELLSCVWVDEIQLTSMADHPLASRTWVTLQCFSRSEHWIFFKFTGMWMNPECESLSSVQTFHKNDY